VGFWYSDEQIVAQFEFKEWEANKGEIMEDRLFGGNELDG
jgi:hypothetical protein